MGKRGHGCGPLREGKRWGCVLGVLVGWAVWLGAGGAVAGEGFHPERILVLPRDAGGGAGLARWHAARGAMVERVFPGQGSLQVVRLRKGESVAVAVAGYRESGWVRFAEPDYRVQAAGTWPNDPRFADGSQWGLNNYGQSGGLPGADVDAPAAWDLWPAGSNVVVAIVDSGIWWSHEDLAAQVWRNPVDGSPGFNALTGGHDPWDDNGHGTHLAGIIGAVANNGKGVAGVAWGVRLMACKFLDASGGGFNSDAVACIEFARVHGAEVLNLSWGDAVLSEAVSNALWFARGDGILVAAAAGNNGRNTDLVPFFPASLGLDNVVAVGASTRVDGVRGSSNFGLRSVDLFAPGEGIVSTESGGDTAYGLRSGSSMSTAYVAGGLAWLRGESPGASGAVLIGRLLAATDGGAAFAGRCVSGGRLNLRRVWDGPRVGLEWEEEAPVLRVAGVAGHGYVLGVSGDLVGWAPVATNFAGGDGVWVWRDGGATNVAQRFYRAWPRVERQ